jgi:SPASM domain peptide maturase of grasp-with-spasm system
MSFMSKHYALYDQYMLFSTNCILIEGYSRGALLDLQRNNFFVIPLSIVKLFRENSKEKLSVIYNQIDEDSIETLDQYIDFFLSEDILLFLSDGNLLNQFPEIQNEFHLPSIISNAIIDIDFYQSDIHGIMKFIQELDAFSCKNLLIRVFSVVDFSKLSTFLNALSLSRFTGVYLFFNSHNFSKEELFDIARKYMFIHQIIVFGQEEYEEISWQLENVTSIILSNQSFNTHDACGVIDESNFIFTDQFYFESISYNSCLNRKISIDIHGNIKNCPSMKESFGKINDTSLMAVVNNPLFKKTWNISKDQISVCKDCEFRYVCMDCRAYLETPSDILSKPLKCGYDPYTGLWEEWSTNPLKHKAIDHYKLRNFSH